MLLKNDQFFKTVQLSTFYREDLTFMNWIRDFIFHSLHVIPVYYTASPYWRRIFSSCIIYCYLNSYWKVSLGNLWGGMVASLMEEKPNYFLNQLTWKARRHVQAALSTCTHIHTRLRSLLWVAARYPQTCLLLPVWSQPHWQPTEWHFLLSTYTFTPYIPTAPCALVTHGSAAADSLPAADPQGTCACSLAGSPAFRLEP